MPNVFSLYDNRDPLENASKVGRGIGAFLSKLGTAYSENKAEQQRKAEDLGLREKVNAIIQEFNNPNSPEYEGMGQAQRYLKAARLLYLAGDPNMSARYEAEANRIRQEEGKFGSAKEIQELKNKALQEKTAATIGQKTKEELAKEAEELKKDLTPDQWRTGQAVSGDNAKYSTWWSKITGDGKYKTWLPSPNESAESRKKYFQTGGKGDIVSGATIENEIAQSGYATNKAAAGNVQSKFEISSGEIEPFDYNGTTFSVYKGVPSFIQPQVNKLSDSYKLETSSSNAQIKSIDQLKATLGTGDLKGVRAIAAVFLQMRSLDPTSTVRESEFDSMAGANGAYGRFINLVNQASSGVTLSAEQVEDMKELADIYRELAVNSINDAKNKYSSLSVNYGINPKFVIGGFYGKEPTPAGETIEVEGKK